MEQEECAIAEKALSAICRHRARGGILMADKKFEAILTLLVPQVVQLICENYPVNEMTASKEFYESKVYSLLEQENTKLWNFNPLTLFNM